jgi:predicted AAA+ superfamily ATPase
VGSLAQYSLSARASDIDLCESRADVLKGVTDADFAPDLAEVIRGVAPEEYLKSDKFFATTARKRVLSAYGTRKEVASIFRLDTSYGGGKTHRLLH